MTANIDLLDRPEPLKRSFVGSLILHGSVAIFVVGYTLVGSREPAKWGEVNGGGMGSVMVNPVARIRLPSHTGPANPVANQSESLVPETVAAKKAEAKVDPDATAIPIKSKKARLRDLERAAAQPNKWRASQPEVANRVPTTVGQSISSPLYDMAGGGGVGIGTDSPLGTQFGWYAKLLRDKIAQNWKTGDVDPRITHAPLAGVKFTLLRDGSLAPGSVKITQSSGNAALDLSAQRAVYDAAPFTRLPDQFAGSQVVLELRFELKR